MILSARQWRQQVQKLQKELIDGDFTDMGRAKREAFLCPELINMGGWWFGGSREHSLKCISGRCSGKRLCELVDHRYDITDKCSPRNPLQSHLFDAFVEWQNCGNENSWTFCRYLEFQISKPVNGIYQHTWFKNHIWEFVKFLLFDFRFLHCFCFLFAFSSCFLDVLFFVRFFYVFLGLFSLGCGWALWRYKCGSDTDGVGESFEAGKKCAVVSFRLSSSVLSRL